GRAVKPQPGPKREASRDLGESSQRIHADRDEDAHHRRAALHCHGSSSSSRLSTHSLYAWKRRFAKTASGETDKDVEIRRLKRELALSYLISHRANRKS
uniref:hypothetical protein n=1 Tax=Paenirhodobacter enshiensis TaxID=1105367 RepID=UPI001B80DEFA